MMKFLYKKQNLDSLSKYGKNYKLFGYDLVKDILMIN